ncbi:hypothetical protein L596_013992 [Steinernema carpocapsae]|uniref:G-protein coupled receptors family 1 profile domain-containing protein n=1 Tax=Steinernema carpocapsae TaxID=34508 RepID=A0A4U5NAA3_STECR|nr:hypothetical protein L596_013992 [Steinernema carpocapsae]
MIDIAPNQTLVFGYELEGRGSPNHIDTIIGSLIWVLSAVAVVLGFYNLYIIKRMKIFHNAFGAFWASRTIGEIGSSIVQVVYSGPVTIRQPSNLAPFYGITAFTIGYFFACHACIMHQIVSVNRMLAVITPLKYSNIFQKKIVISLIAFCWVAALIALLLYLVIPCNMVGYSPQLYEYVFVKCDPYMERDFSYVGTFVNRFCWCLCFSTFIFDAITLSKIIYVRVVGFSNKNYKRDVRFFAQTSVQNFTMMIALTMIVIVNNSQSLGSTVLYVLAFNTLIATHINNALALIIFNPEVRARFRKYTTSSAW